MTNKTVYLSTMVLALVVLAGSSQAIASLSDGLVAQFSFESTIDDASDFNHVGVVTDAEYVDGATLSGLDFSGNPTSYLEVPHSDSLNPSAALTVSFWAKAERATNEWMGVLYKAAEEPVMGTGYRERVYSFWIGSNRVAHFSSTGEGAQQQSYCNSPPLAFRFNEFVHFAGVIDTLEQVMKVYVNGRFVAECDYPYSAIRSGSYPLRIGSPFIVDTDEGAFDGVMDEVKIYSKVLTDAEIKAEYLAGGGTSPNSPANSITIDTTARLG
ncbi:MAG: LamG domain-containing protein, partial [Gammaproteobacteria bacterium]|nr:LamG domain-containing protein [Gammaproteobacteria bacterium]